MRFLKYGLLLGFAFILVLLGCKTEKETTKSNLQTNEAKGPFILEFDNGVKVPQSEFEYIYAKNNGGKEEAAKHTPEQLQEYLDLYINFKRKVMEAESMGLADTKEFKQEFEGYKRQLDQPYLVEQEVQENLIKEAYERSKEQVSASHLLIAVGPEAGPDDTLKAFEKINKIREEISSGKKKFAEAAKEYSNDPSAKENSGYLGYFSVFDMVYPFETGAYNTTVGEVSQPIRTGYGYHLIYVDDKVKNEGTKKAAHIIIRVGPQYSAKDDKQAEQKINEINARLQKGEAFTELAKEFSDDPITAAKGGDLGTGRLIPEMENWKRKLSKGEFSEPFKTDFGWHILTITEATPIKSFEDSEAEIKSRISRDARSFLSKEKLIDRVKEEYNYTPNTGNLNKHVASIGDQKAQYLKGMWRPVDTLHGSTYELPLYTIGSGDEAHTGTVKNFIDWYVRKRKGYDGISVDQAAQKNFDLWIDDEMQQYEASQLPNKYPEYRELLREYRDGILLFTLTEDKVWRKAVEDTTGLKNFYEENKNDFKAAERVVATEYRSETEEVLTQVEKLLEAGKTDDEIDSEINKTSSLNLKIRTQTYEKGKTDMEDVIFGKEIGYRTPISKVGTNSFRILVVKKSKPAGTKTFEEAKSECITQYQNYLEETWLAELKNKYPVTVNDEVLNQLFK
jgi:peptidyl-prolyl cis-trans isomerase SurA